LPGSLLKILNSLKNLTLFKLRQCEINPLYPILFLTGMKDLIIKFSKDESILQDILDLQRINLRTNLHPDEIDSQGFLYVQHTYDSLKKICATEPAVIALDGEKLAGYALCMNKVHSMQVPELWSFFSSLDKLTYQHKALQESTYLVCGQICIAKAYRGFNLMRRLYNTMSELKTKYQYCITEVSSQNIRSLNAHFKVGFKPIHEFLEENGELWHILLWDWNWSK
jgi:GNAT superfamily N-acetyltransferase